MLDIGSTIVQRYRIEARLGRGGMGEVYRARQLGLDRLVALKVLLPEHGQTKGARQRFIREARVAAALTHPNVVEIYDFGEDGEVAFLVMELLQGRSLREELNESDALPLDRFLGLAMPLTGALTAAHEHGIVHRDLKPENLILDRQNDRERLVVLDFGLAFFVDATNPELGRCTRTGEIWGSSTYMAPEQARGEPVSFPADIYAAGCLFVEMLAGVPPFTGALLSVMMQHQANPPRRLYQLRPGARFPGPLEDLIAQMLRKSPDQRPTAREVLAALEEIERPVPADVGHTQRSSTAESDRDTRILALSETRVAPIGNAPAALTDTHVATRPRPIARSRSRASPTRSSSASFG